MITYTTGDMFKSGADCLINTVNCEGFMGKGIAYQFKLNYPENNKAYIKACSNGTLHIGSLHYFNEDNKTIINFPTKNKWREKSRLDYIDKGLDELIRLLPNLKVSVIAMPPLGCGNGGLIWSDVKDLIERKLKNCDKNLRFIVFEPSSSYKQIAKEPPQLSASSLILMQIKMRSNKFNSIRLQKVAFFTNLYLKDDYFKFDKYKFGPYAHSIDIISRNIREYQNYYNLKNTLDTYEMAYKVLCSDSTKKTLERIQPAIEKATTYVNNIKSDKDLEGIATVLFLIQKNINNSNDNIIKNFKEWSEDKANRFTVNEINGYIEYLENTDMIYKDILGYYKISEYINTRSSNSNLSVFNEQ